MAAPSDRDDYSTLEVATNSDIMREGKYPEVVPPAIPEAYGYYGPPKPEHTTPQPHGAQIAPYPASAHLPPTAHTYSTYPEVVDNGDVAKTADGEGSKGARICGLPRKFFWLALVGAILIIIGVIVGVVVGTMSKGHTVELESNGGGSGSGSGSANNDTGSSPTTKLSLFNDTRLASANFTDAYGNNNFLLVYQLSDASIRMSAFNSSNSKWVVSDVLNGTEGVKLGSSLAIDTFWQGTNSPDVNLYYQSDGASTTIKSLLYSTNDTISTTSVTPSDKWQAMAATSEFNSMPGSSLVAYGKQCGFCNQYAYLFWQGQSGLYMAGNTGDGIKDADLIDTDTAPSANTSMALTYSGTLQGDSDAVLRRSISVFYRSKTSALAQLRIGNGMNVPAYVGRDIGPSTNFAAFSTGFNESESDNPTPLGFQVLSIDPEGDDGVQLSYLKDGAWATATGEIKDLADCQAKAMMAVNTGRRLYCLVDSGDDAGVEIIEWAWQGDPSDTTSYLDWEKVGAVDIVTPDGKFPITDLLSPILIIFKSFAPIMPGNVWFIVGASSGFGRAIALEALSRGDKVAAASRHPSKMTNLEDAGAMILKLDVTSDERVIMNIMQTVVDVYGKITHCVNATGYLLEGVIEAASQDEVHRIVATNVLGTATVTRCALRFLRPRGFGVIANFGSLASWEGGLAYGYYSVKSATKWAVSGFTESLNLECRPLGIAAVVIEPGYFRTEVLNEGGGHRLVTKEQLLSDYTDSGLATQKDLIMHLDNNQLGDVKKGAGVIVDVLTQTGVTSGRNIPVRLVLGSDAIKAIRNKIKATETLLKEWEDVIVSTDRDDAAQKV
ncbi:hypothetical protein E0Z10_g2763 [Xylaria hypoxylon]|uniref:Fucose-specific lectin n=1 Tax=Xylaria hypoxylon TaxID=37992 RepID=A0A4Z0Z1C7_9PEZI|nr:hypothetical protein E0Z10_g2763 [Xylaria hypoxylon]